jgi:positive regulator of sigma E activity
MNRIKLLLRSPLFWVILFATTAIGIRYVQCYIPFTGGDSSGYITCSENITNILTGNIDTTRTPIYPAFLALCNIITGEENYLYTAVLLQYLFLLFSVYVLYVAGTILFYNRLFVAAACIIYTALALRAYSMPERIFPSCILTETFAIVSTILFFYGLISFVKKPTYWKSAVIGLGTFFLIMLRPSFSAFLPLTGFFLLGMFPLCRNEWKKICTGILMLCVSFIAVLGYSRLVQQKIGVFTVSVVSLINLNDCLIQSGLYQNCPDKEVAATVKESMQKYVSQHLEAADNPYYLMEFDTWNGGKQFDPVHLIPAENQNTWVRMNNYIWLTLKANPISYVYYVIRKCIWLTSQGNIFNGVYIVLFINVTALLCFFRKIPAEETYLHFICFLFTLVGVLTAFAFAQCDYPRLIMPILPLLALLMFLPIDRLFATNIFVKYIT